MTERLLLGETKAETATVALASRLAKVIMIRFADFCSKAVETTTAHPIILAIVFTFCSDTILPHYHSSFR